MNELRRYGICDIKDSISEKFKNLKKVPQCVNNNIKNEYYLIIVIVF